MPIDFIYPDYEVVRLSLIHIWTLFGAKPPKGQELEDHYFGAIKPRVCLLYTSSRCTGGPAAP